MSTLSAQLSLSLRFFLAYGRLTSVDEHAIAFALALVADTPVAKSRSATMRARGRQFIIHSIGLNYLVGRYDVGGRH